MLRVMVVASAALLASANPAAATDYNVVHLQATGCARCDVTVHGMVQRWGDWKGFSQTVSLYDGIGSAWIPARFTTVGFLVQDRARRTGWNSVTSVALRYRGFQPGDSVTKSQSRNAKWAQACMTVTAPESWITFHVVKDRNPTKWKGKDPTWTKYSLRAWASPQIEGTGLFNESFHGRSSTQNPSCGYAP